MYYTDTSGQSATGNSFRLQNFVSLEIEAMESSVSLEVMKV